MQFNSKYVFQCQNAIFAKGDFSLRFVSACVCSDLDLCHVSELGSRQMGLILCCADVVEIIFGTNNLTGVFFQFVAKGFPGGTSKDVKHLKLSW